MLAGRNEMQLLCRSLVAAAVLGASCSGGGVPDREGSASAGRPNIVLIISDDHGWPDYGFMGHPDVRTPALDRLASQSMLYTRGYVPAPLCRPSLATIATGLYPHEHGVTGNDPPGERPASARDPANRAAMEAVFSQNDNVIELLGRSGYSSHQSGKWWEGSPLDHGFTEAMTHGDVTRRGRHGDEGLVIGREGMEPIFSFIQARGALDAAQSAAGSGDQGFVPDDADRPFFVWYAPFLPHTPHNPPERLVEKYRVPGREEPIAKYFAMVEWLDETVGQLCDFLDRERLAENTLVMYIADNGWLQLPVAQEQAKARAKLTPYEMGVRTPVMIRWPGKVAPGRDDETLVSSIDLAPTILAATGIDALGYLPGIDLLDREALAAREMVFGETFAHTSVDLENPVSNLKYRTVVRKDGWKLIEPYKPNKDVTLRIRDTALPWMKLEPELYRLTDDPHETNDLAATQPEIVSELHAALQEWWDVPE